MANTSTLRDRLRAIRRKFKHVSPHRFFYNTKRELKRKHNRIKVWFLIHDADKGYSVFPIEWKRALAMTVQEWRIQFTQRVNYDPIFNIFVLKVLPAINVRSGAQWKFKALIGWAGWDDIRQVGHSHSHSARHKTVKKRNANARNRSRG